MTTIVMAVVLVLANLWKYPQTTFGKMTNKKMVEELVERGQPKGKLNKADMQFTILLFNKKKVCWIIGVLF